MFVSLKKSLYGLKQAPRAWFHQFSTFIQRIGFSASKSDSSLLIYHSATQTAYLLLYVDDVVLTAFLNIVIDSLNSEFSMTDLGLLTISLVFLLADPLLVSFSLNVTTFLNSSTKLE